MVTKEALESVFREIKMHLTEDETRRIDALLEAGNLQRVQLVCAAYTWELYSVQDPPQMDHYWRRLEIPESRKRMLALRFGQYAAHDKNPGHA